MQVKSNQTMLATKLATERFSLDNNTRCHRHVIQSTANSFPTRPL